MRKMERKNASYLLIVLLVGIFALWGCPKKTDVAVTPEVQREEVAASVPQEETAVPAEAGLQPVYFQFDESFLNAEAGETIKANAEWLKANPQVRIRIEGNCDERGTIHYNQALGQRRAANAKKYLTDLGIPAARISLISYGKEKPGCTQSTEYCWQQNRRDDFKVVAD